MWPFRKKDKVLPEHLPTTDMVPSTSRGAFKSYVYVLECVAALVVMMSSQTGLAFGLIMLLHSVYRMNNADAYEAACPHCGTTQTRLRVNGKDLKCKKCKHQLSIYGLKLADLSGTQDAKGTVHTEAALTGNYGSLHPWQVWKAKKAYAIAVMFFLAFWFVNEADTAKPPALKQSSAYTSASAVSAVDYEIAKRTESEQVGGKSIDERWILNASASKEEIRSTLTSRYEKLKKDGFQKIFIYAYPSKEALQSPLMWASRLEWLEGGSPHVIFNDEQLAQIDKPKPTTQEAKPAPIPVQENGDWIVAEDQSPMDDSKTVTLALDADAPIRAWLKSPTPVLLIACRENKTEVIVYTGTAANPELGSYHEASVRIRLDKEQAFSQKWSESTNNEGLFAPHPITLARQLAKADTMTFEFTPFNSGKAVATFNLRGLADKLPLVAQTCGWKM